MVIAPVTRPVEDLDGATVDLVVGQVLNITTGDAPGEYFAGTVDKPEVAKFVAGHDDGSAKFNPGVTALAAGRTSVTVTDKDSTVRPTTFTVVVSQR
ncbi:hypothetical protein GCM10027169_24500 [Gordonia jinhuaensis]|uniref:Uncharacterized protein n=1 Tax=Gordonia jinhuaensis TaxID=1517702 RepID=A0A916WWP2_9ACTN|nr:hypothetical protein [Gordonia jinhuaensis]GGB39892.1 hypothetical protein GCM10011489_29380 [Gordonia jinhuaensis]